MNLPFLRLFCSTLAVSACTATPPPRVEMPARQTTRAILGRVADWQLAHLDRFDYVDPVGRTPDRRGWVQGVFWLGLASFADDGQAPAYRDAIARLGDEEGWRLGDRLYVADDHLIGQTYLKTFARTRDPRHIAALRSAFDAILQTPPTVALEYGPRDAAGRIACLPRWCWADALFMAPATWAGLTAATGDPRYLAYAKRELRATTALLYDSGERLFYRDSRFITMRGAGGAKIFWSRGNGWVLAGLAGFLKVMPDNDPDRPEFAALFAAMAGRIATLQRSDGSWPASLIEPDQPAAGETSGAALFIYAMAWGVKAGLLDAGTFRAPMDRGWRHIVGTVDAAGRVGSVQQIGDAPQTPGPRDTQLYGSGAVLLAGSAMLDLATAPSRR